MVGRMPAREAAKLTTPEMVALLQQAELAEAKVSLEWVYAVHLKADEIRVKLALPHRPPIYVESRTAMALRRRGIEQRIVVRPNHAKAGPPDLKILEALSLGARFWRQLNQPAPMTATGFARAEKVDTAHVCRTLRAAFFAPALVDCFVRGEQPIDWTAKKLMRWVDQPLSWTQQVRHLRDQGHELLLSGRK